MEDYASAFHGERNAQLGKLMNPSPITERSLLETIWYRPTETLGFILQFCPKKYVTPLLVLGGISRAIGRAADKGYGDTMELWAVLTLAIVLGGLFGWMGYYMYAWGMRVTGNWLNGKANTEQFRTVLAWSLVPAIGSLVLLIPELIIIGEDLFKSEPDIYSNAIAYSYILFGILEMTLGIWSIVILVKGTSIIQKFSVWKSILNVFLPGIIIAAPLILIALVASMF